MKQLEGRLRVYDMKSISSFSKNVSDIHFLARAMGYLEADMNAAAQRFLDDYQQTTQTVREHFVSVVGEL